MSDYFKNIKIAKAERVRAVLVKENGHDDHLLDDAGPPKVKGFKVEISLFSEEEERREDGFESIEFDIF